MFRLCSYNKANSNSCTTSSATVQVDVNWLSSIKESKTWKAEKLQYSDSLDDVSFNNYHSLTQTILEMTQIQMLCGTYDPLWLISRWNTESVDRMVKESAHDWNTGLNQINVPISSDLALSWAQMDILFPFLDEDMSVMLWQFTSFWLNKFWHIIHRG